MKLFEKWDEGGGNVKSGLELADMTGADLDLVSESAPCFSIRGIVVLTTHH